MKRLLLLIGWLITSFVSSTGAETIIRVPDDYGTIAEAISAAPDGAVIEIAEGDYWESIQIDRPLSLLGDGQVILHAVGDEAVIAITDTHNVVIEGLHLQGGKYGIFVTRSQRVQIQHNLIEGSRLVGIKVRMASVRIVGNIIQNALAPYGRGIHITNTTDYPPSQVLENTIQGNALSGISTNMTSLVVIERNTLQENGQIGIAVTEMSHAVVRGNQVESNGENGIYITDQSLAAVCDNTIRDTYLTHNGGSGRYGNGITIDFYSIVELRDNTVDNNARYEVGVVGFSQVTIGGQGSNTIELWLETGSSQLPNADLPFRCG
jgi:parallel beta-helix repeat protein